MSRPQDQVIEVCDLDSVWPSGSGSLDRESFRQRLRARGASSDRAIDTLFNAFTGGTYLITRFAWVCTCANTAKTLVVSYKFLISAYISHKHHSLWAGARKIEIGIHYWQLVHWMAKNSRKTNMGFLCASMLKPFQQNFSNPSLRKP